MHRFFVPAEAIQGGRASLEGGVARQVCRVLRMSPGDQVVLLDGSGSEYVTRLDRLSPTVVEGVVVSTRDGQGEPRVRLFLYQALLKGARFEWVLQKGTELGVSTFVPIEALRSVPRPRASWQETHYVRWRGVIREAAEQAGRSVLPQLRPPVALSEACRECQGTGLSIIPWESETGRSLGTVLQGERRGRVNLFIGPEGGWADEEVAQARAHGVTPVSLGQRILRAETAAVAAAAAVMYALGELERQALPDAL